MEAEATLRPARHENPQEDVQSTSDPEAAWSQRFANIRATVAKIPKETKEHIRENASDDWYERRRFHGHDEAGEWPHDSSNKTWPHQIESTAIAVVHVKSIGSTRRLRNDQFQSIEQ